MSSIRMQSRPATSPMTFITSDTPAPLAALVDDGEVAVQPRRQQPRAQHAADIGRYDHDVAPLVALLDVEREQRRGIQIVHRDVEEPLDLGGVQIHRQHAVGAGFGDQVGDELGADRRARAGFAVLAGVTEIRQHRRDPAGGGAAQRVERDQQLHQVVVGPGRRWDCTTNTSSPRTFSWISTKHFHVGEMPHRGAGQRQLQHRRHGLGQGAVTVAGDRFSCCASYDTSQASLAAVATHPRPVEQWYGFTCAAQPRRPPAAVRRAPGCRAASCRGPSCARSPSRPRRRLPAPPPRRHRPNRRSASRREFRSTG